MLSDPRPDRNLRHAAFFRDGALRAAQLMVLPSQPLLVPMGGLTVHRDRLIQAAMDDQLPVGNFDSADDFVEGFPAAAGHKSMIARASYGLAVREHNTEDALHTRLNHRPDAPVYELAGSLIEAPRAKQP